jgi:hypothetical protein
MPNDKNLVKKALGRWLLALDIFSFKVFLPHYILRVSIFDIKTQVDLCFNATNEKNWFPETTVILCLNCCETFVEKSAKNGGEYLR